ncbi:hypothetical protein ABZ892_16615 [Streptomyces sp. NPDC046924]|uniref:hypothetical protein n=1 Tax=Streptomyces sp. NPDC046924 TaxID=3155136 RepID=UPI00340E1A39
MSDELATALRELAADHEAPPPVPAAEVRTRARRRARRRRATVAFGTATTAACVLTTIGLTGLTGHAEEPVRNRHLPAASSGARTSGVPRTAGTSASDGAPIRSAAATDGFLDLGRRTLTIGGHVMHVDSYAVATLPPGHRLTVRAKHKAVTLPGDPSAENRRGTEVPYVVELRTGNRPPVYAGALAGGTKSLGVLGAKTGWLGLSVKDARWFYARVRQGELIEITSAPLPEPGAPAPPTRSAAHAG